MVGIDSVENCRQLTGVAVISYYARKCYPVELPYQIYHLSPL